MQETGALPSGDYVLANFRYLSAYNELVARIGQRQHTLALFVAIFTGLISALFFSRDIFRTDQHSIVWLMSGFPFATLVLTFLNYKYESLIGILRRYLADLERVQDAHLALPSYNCDPAYIWRANQARHFHDLACAVLILAYNIAAIGTYASLTGGESRPYPAVMFGIGAVALACTGAHLLMRRIYYRPEAPAGRA